MAVRGELDECGSRRAVECEGVLLSRASECLRGVGLQTSLVNCRGRPSKRDPANLDVHDICRTAIIRDERELLLHL